MIYKAFDDDAKVGLLVFLELSSERIPRVELGIADEHEKLLS